MLGPFSMASALRVLRDSGVQSVTCDGATADYVFIDSLIPGWELVEDDGMDRTDYFVDRNLNIVITRDLRDEITAPTVIYGRHTARRPNPPPPP